MVNFLKTTVLGGLIFLIPFAFLVIVLEKIFRIVHKVVDPIANRIHTESIIGLEIPVLATIVVMVLACFLLGLLAGTRVARKTVSALEASFLNNIPGYSVMKSMSADLQPLDNHAEHTIVLVQFDEAWQIGLKIEEIAAENRVVVFIPDSPTPQTGAVLIVDASRVRPANIPILTAFSCLRARGVGLKRAIDPASDQISSTLTTNANSGLEAPVRS